MATISAEAGSPFSAFDGDILGITLVTARNRLIVQSWRASHWRKADLDSILTLEFVKDGEGGAIHLAHVNVPDHDYDGVKAGWRAYYWKPLRAYLPRPRAQARPIAGAPTAKRVSTRKGD
jgi:activator of HSP90 ATPase